MDYFLGQIGIFGFNFAPVQWALCNNAILPIAQNTALFSLLGTTYGGNGTSTFALPDLRGRAPVHFGNASWGENYALGEMAGVENVTLLFTEMPLHTHGMVATSQNGDLAKIEGGIFAQAASIATPVTNYPAYGPVSGPTTLNPQSVSFVGGNQQHNNLQPLQVINYCIATGGIYPSRN